MAVSVGQVAAGIDPATGLAHPVKVDANGNISIIGGGVGNSVFGTGTVGIAPPQAPVNVGGVDAGGLLRNVLLDATGAQVAVGKGANGAAVSGNPVLIAGSDGANTRSFKTDANGALNVLGTVSSNTVAAPNPIVIAGHDGARVQYIHTDPSGNIYTVAPPGAGGIVFGSTPNGAAPAQAPNLIAGWDGVNTRTLLTDLTGAAQVVSANRATYTTYMQNGTITGPANGVLLQLQGSATKKIKLRRATFQCQATAIATIAVQLLVGSSSAPGGIAAPISKFDTNDPNPTAVAQQFSALVAPAFTVLNRLNVDFVTALASANGYSPIYEYKPLETQPIILNGIGEFLTFYVSYNPPGFAVAVNFYWTEE